MAGWRHQRRFERKPRTSASHRDFGCVDASRRSATKPADARRGAAVCGERRQAAGAASPIAADEQGVPGSQLLLSKFVGRWDDLADGELHRLCVAAQATPPNVTSNGSWRAGCSLLCPVAGNRSPTALPW